MPSEPPPGLCPGPTGGANNGKIEKFRDFWTGIWEDNTNAPVITISENKFCKTIKKMSLSTTGIEGIHNFGGKSPEELGGH